MIKVTELKNQIILVYNVKYNIVDIVQMIVKYAHNVCIIMVLIKIKLHVYYVNKQIVIIAYQIFQDAVNVNLVMVLIFYMKLVLNAHNFVHLVVGIIQNVHIVSKDMALIHNLILPISLVYLAHQIVNIVFIIIGNALLA